LRLLIDVTPALGDHGQRGIGRYVRGLAASIATFPDDLSDRIWALGPSSPTLDLFRDRAIPLEARPGPARGPTFVTSRLAMGSALKSSGARVLHATDPQRPWTPRVRSLVTVYDLIPLREREMLRSWRIDQRLLYRRYIRQITSAERIISISRATATDLHERLGIAAELIDVVYPLVAPPPHMERAESPEPAFLFVGALSPHKQPELALRGFAQFQSRFRAGRLRYIGPSDQQQERRLHDLAASLGVLGSVSLDGRVSERDLELAYASATALISTSRIEGFGLPGVEAALRGVPVIAVATPAATETLDGVATIVPADADAIAQAMDGPVAPSVHAVDALRERYSIATVARSLADSYRRMLD